jgi:uncharacterized SAM-binding protein YcdF (DUF218 family)
MRIILTVLLVGFLFWFSGLVSFVQRIPTTATADDISTDAIIVLTGGSLRVERGFELFGQDKAPTLFISGVGKDTTLQDLLTKYGNPSVREKVQQGAAHIVLDYRADSTYGNAREAAKFIRDYDLTSVRLVTSNYHMPRSLVEFQSVLPNLIIIQDSVLPTSFHHENWWKDAPSRRLVLSEYHKMMAAFFRAHFYPE